MFYAVGMFWVGRIGSPVAGRAGPVSVTNAAISGHGTLHHPHSDARHPAVSGTWGEIALVFVGQSDYVRLILFRVHPMSTHGTCHHVVPAGSVDFGGIWVATIP